MKRLQKRKHLCFKVGDSSDIDKFGYGNIEWQENLMFSNGRAGSIPARATINGTYPKKRVGAIFVFKTYSSQT